MSFRNAPLGIKLLFLVGQRNALLDREAVTRSSKPAMWRTESSLARVPPRLAMA